MLDKTTTTKILDIVRKKPCTIQEIAHVTDRNWRTAERYVADIARETGMIDTRTFREGTRGALKIVYWRSTDQLKGSAYQERLLQRILNARKKDDFSAFDIYQFVAPKLREAYMEKTEFPRHPNVNYDKMLLEAKEQVLFFSGNLSWMEVGPQRMKTIERMAKQRISIKILTRVDITSMKNTEIALAINKRVGWDAIEIRHCEQPLRVAIVDDALATIKEVIVPGRAHELAGNAYLFYVIRDQKWIQWLQNIFWHLWGQSVDAHTRINALQTLKKAVK